MATLQPILRPILPPLTRAIGAAGGGVLPEITSMITVVAGNSIVSRAKYTGAKWNPDQDLHHACAFSGGAMRFKRITATTRTDKYGVYGYSGQTLGTINADIAAQWFAPINAAGVVPELVIGLALLENDVAAGDTVATMQTRLQAWISAVQTEWPAAKILLCTPRPAATYDTVDKVANYQGIRDYILSLDNGSTILCSRLDSYEDPANPGKPLAGFTTDGLHPSTAGAMSTSRRIAATLRRIGTPVLADPIVSVNRYLTGSVVATGTNLTGTKPTGTGSGGGTSATHVSDALEPGWSLEMTNTTGATLGTTYPINTQADSIPGAPTYISPYSVVEVVSGAENLRFLTVDARILDGGGNSFHYYMLPASGDGDGVYQNGDRVTFIQPPESANSGSITQLLLYPTMHLKSAAVPVTIRLVEAGYTVVT